MAKKTNSSKPKTPRNVKVAEPVRIVAKEHGEDEGHDYDADSVPSGTLPPLAPISAFPLPEEAPDLSNATDEEIAAAIAEAQAEGAEEAKQVDTAIRAGSVIPKEVKKAYGKTQSCNDEIALWLKALLSDKFTLEEIGNANAVKVSARWGHLNTGMQRMNLGNVLRNRVKEGVSLAKPVRS